MTEWSEHVKRYAKKHKMTYQQANKNDKCKEAYRKKRMSPKRMKMHPGAGGGAANGDRGDGRRRIPLASELPDMAIELQEIIHEYLNCEALTWARYSSETQKIIIDSRLKKLMENLESRYPEFYNDETPRMAEFKAPRKPTWEQFSRVCEEALQLGFTELIRLCRTGYNIRKVEQLINMGVDLNKMDEVLTQPLFYALISGSKDLINILLRNKANISRMENSLVQALNREIAQFSYKKIPILVAAGMGNIDLVRILLDKDPDTNLKNYKGQNVLHVAASSENSSFELIRLLIERGSILDERDHYEKTALHYAAENGNVEAVNTLVMLGADINAKDKRDETPLMLARKKNHLIVDKILHKAGALEFKRELDLRDLELLEDHY